MIEKLTIIQDIRKIVKSKRTKLKKTKEVVENEIGISYSTYQNFTAGIYGFGVKILVWYIFEKLYQMYPEKIKELKKFKKVIMNAITTPPCNFNKR